jgi:RNA polymerase primary sigma factor
MVPTRECSMERGLCKLEPNVKLPPAVTDSLSPADAKLIWRRLREPVECVFDPCFLEPGTEEALLAPVDAGVSTGGPGNDDSGADLLAAGRAVSLTTEQEHHFFLRLNFCRYRVLQIMQDYAGRRLTADKLGELLRWEHLAAQTREDIIRVNIPLVLAMAKRTRITGVDFSDLISEGNLALLRSVEKFDCARGFKFSTYACRAILKSFSRVAMRTSRYRGYFPTEFDPTLEKSDFVEKKRIDTEGDCLDELKSILGRNLARLTDVEQQVIRARFALDQACGEVESARARTLEQVGEMIGVTKERVRQIQNKALDKLRNVLESGLLAS